MTGEATSKKNGMEQLAAALRQLTQFHQQQQERFDKAQRRQEERQDRKEARRPETEVRDRQVTLMQEKNDAQIRALQDVMMERRDATKAAHLQIVPFEILKTFWTHLRGS